MAEIGSTDDAKNAVVLQPRPLPTSACCWHRRDVNCVKISSSGRFVASAADDYRVLISDLVTGRLLYELAHDEACINSLMWLHQQVPHLRLVTGSGNGSVTIWTLHPNGGCTQTILIRLKEEIDHLEYDVATDKLLLAFGSFLMVTPSQTPLDTIKAEHNPLDCSEQIGGAAFLASGTKCLVTLPDRHAIVVLRINGTTLSVEKTISLSYTPHYASVSSDSMSIGVGGTDGMIRVYDWRKGEDAQEQVVVSYGRDFITPRSVTFSFIHGSHYLIAGGETEVATVFDLTDGRAIATLYHQKGCYIHAVTAWSDLNTVRIVTGSSYGRHYVVLWECPIAQFLSPKIQLTGQIAPTLRPGSVHCDHYRPEEIRYPCTLFVPLMILIAMCLCAFSTAQNSTNAPWRVATDLLLSRFSNFTQKYPLTDVKSAPQKEFFIKWFLI
ncbi:hypothetical protein FS842_002690 [Serendipita sp. 407]|nr:hypothetical protein FS842_002690 [Serendipita sp. 407]